MWFLKGALSGIAICIVFTLYYLKAIVGPIRQNVATGLSAITGPTVYQPLYWLALSLILSSAILCAFLVSRFAYPR